MNSEVTQLATPAIYKPTFSALMQRHRIDRRMLWRASGYSLHLVWIDGVLAGQGMPLYLVERMLSVFNKLTGQSYKIADLHVTLMERK